MYMPDALRACVELMEADPTRLIHRNSFNITSMSLTPEGIAASIREVIPTFEMTYELDELRQGIADSWPNSLDDSCARSEWDWKPQSRPARHDARYDRDHPPQGIEPFARPTRYTSKQSTLLSKLYTKKQGLCLRT